MKKSKYSAEQVAFALRQAESGTPAPEICRKMGISEQTFYRWKKKYVGEKSSKIDNLTFERLTDGMVEILDNRAMKTDRLKQFQSQIKSQKERIRETSNFAAYLARLFFDAELFVVGEQDN